jgi:hypothetical protein
VPDGKERVANPLEVTATTAPRRGGPGALVRRTIDDLGLRREAEMMGLYVSLTLLAVLLTGNDLEEHTKLDVLWIVWGTTIGLAIAHWFALVLSVRLVPMNWADVQSGPAFGFTVVGLVIVFGPLVAERLRLPGLLGLLMFGAVIGPNMLDVLPRFAGLQAVGSIGVLYLIFLAGLQLDLEAFVRYRVISGGFGLLTAVIPMALGTGVALLLDIDRVPRC